MQDPSPYVLTREGDQWIFRPSRLLVALMVGCVGGGSALCLYLSVIFLQTRRSVAMWIETICFSLAALFAGMAAWAWQTRRRPLTVGSNGRVCYGERELCAAGTVRSLRIAPSPGGEAGDCQVCLELDGGKLISVPSPYFAGFGMKRQAQPFAKALAGALDVRLAE